MVSDTRGGGVRGGVIGVDEDNLRRIPGRGSESGALYRQNKTS